MLAFFFEGKWNDERCDQTLAAATHLCDGADRITIKLGSKAILTVPPTPMLLQPCVGMRKSINTSILMSRRSPL
jgi:hypothetical protein